MLKQFLKYLRSDVTCVMLVDIAPPHKSKKTLNAVRSLGCQLISQPPIIAWPRALRLFFPNVERKVIRFKNWGHIRNVLLCAKWQKMNFAMAKTYLWPLVYYFSDQKKNNNGVIIVDWKWNYLPLNLLRFSSFIWLYISS